MRIEGSGGHSAQQLQMGQQLQVDAVGKGKKMVEEKKKGKERGESKKVCFR